MSARGSPTSHAAILARATEIPAVVGVDISLDDLGGGTRALVDGTTGRFVVAPSDAEVASAGSDAAADAGAVVDAPVETADGVSVAVTANASTPAAAARATEHGADGIGLCRTEFCFAGRDAPPTEAEQYETYRATLDAAPSSRVVVRTLDVGGDKAVPGLGGGGAPTLDGGESAAGPLGRRGIRRSLADHAGAFETQLRALLRASADCDGLCVMFPMVSTVDEFRTARERLRGVAADLDADGVAHGDPDVGAMVETPAATLLADELAAEADFLGIGTNDLTQYVMAAGRDCEAVADLHDGRQPAVLRAIATVARSARGRDCRLEVCGELAADTALTPFLAGLGVDELSVSPVSVPPSRPRCGPSTRTTPPSRNYSAPPRARQSRICSRSEVWSDARIEQPVREVEAERNDGFEQIDGLTAENNRGPTHWRPRGRGIGRRTRSSQRSAVSKR
ncbi:putative PEP-binding protein [Halosimplex aquaticum]